MVVDDGLLDPVNAVHGRGAQLNSLFFNASGGDKIAFALGSTVGLTGPLSIGMIVRLTTQSGARTLVKIGFGNTTSTEWSMWIGGGFNLESSNFAADSTGGPIVVRDEWQFMGLSKAAGGGSGVRYHIYFFDDQVWTHANGTGLNDNAIGDGSIQFMQENGASPCNGHLFMAGIWNRELQDADFLPLATYYDHWIQSNPLVMWKFDTMSAIAPVVGTGSETSRTGTTLSDQLPPNFSDAMKPVRIAPRQRVGAF